MELELVDAIRHRVNLILAICGVSGSGKTYSALLLAAGIAGPGGKIAFLDTENGRGIMYADSPGIKAAIPQGYKYIELAAPFAPARYVKAIDICERAGIQVLVIDSGTHEWEGTGGCSDMAEEDKNRWNRAKREHKRFLLRLLNSKMHIIVCLRAREKTKIIAAKDSPTGKEIVMPLGILPVAEKNFVFEMMCSWMVKEETHLASPLKLPEQFQKMFPEPRLLTKADGDLIREWNDSAAQMDPLEKLQRQARSVAETGMAEYGNFYKSLSNGEKKALADSTHEENKQIAAQADQDNALDELADMQSLPGFIDRLGSLGYESIDQIKAPERIAIIASLRAELEPAATT